MSGLEDTLNNKNEQNEKLPQNPEVQETVESTLDMQKRLSKEMTKQNEQLKSEDAKIETANNSIGLPVEEVQEEKNAMNLDTEISIINAEAEKLTNESKNDLIENKEKSDIDGVDFIFAEHPELEKIGTKEQYKQYIENVFPESKVKDIVYHSSKVQKDNFDKKYIGSNNKKLAAGQGFYFTKDKNFSKIYGKHLTTAIINLENPANFNTSSDEYLDLSEEEQQKIVDDFEKNNDSIIDDRTDTYYNENDELVDSVGSDYIVFEPDQIHILGSKQDIQEFGNYVKNEGKLTNESKNEISTGKNSTEFEEKETAPIILDETYMQHGINAILNSSEGPEDAITRDFLKNFQTTMKIEEFKNITPYLRSEHQTINGLLRQDKEVNIENVLSYKGKELNDSNKEWNADVIESFQALEDCIEKSQLTVPEEGVGKEVYRIIKGDHLADFNQGDTITEKSFLSTSLDESYKEHYLNDADEETVLTIKFPEKSKVNGIIIGNVEHEFLLPRNMSYKIIDKKVTLVNGVRKFEIEAEFLQNEHVRI